VGDDGQGSGAPGGRGQTGEAPRAAHMAPLPKRTDRAVSVARPASQKDGDGGEEWQEF